MADDGERSGAERAPGLVVNSPRRPPLSQVPTRELLEFLPWARAQASTAADAELARIVGWCEDRLRERGELPPELEPEPPTCP